MSTSLLYHGFGVYGYDYVCTKFFGGAIFITIKPKDKLIRCSVCGSFNVVRRGCILRKLRTLPIGDKCVWLLAETPRVQCRKCKCVRQIKVPLAHARYSYTKAFEQYVLGLCKVMTLQDVSKKLKICWDCVKDIFKRHLSRRYGKPKLSKLQYIAIDEISVRKGHKYITLVMDIVTGAVVFVGDGKGADALIPFWKQVQRAKAKIVAVATDMSPAYISSVLENSPQSSLVFDHFHVVKLMNEKLTEVRRGLYREQKEILQKNVLKGSRWILLKNPENLNKDKGEQQRLAEALEINKPLATAYYLKEELRQMWQQPDKKTAAEFIEGWIARAEHSAIGPLISMARTIASHRFGILAWYDHPISSGAMEGTNNKIKTMKRMAYGYRDMEFFKLRIMGIHEAKYALTG